MTIVMQRELHTLQRARMESIAKEMRLTWFDPASLLEVAPTADWAIMALMPDAALKSPKPRTIDHIRRISFTLVTNRWLQCLDDPVTLGCTLSQGLLHMEEPIATAAAESVHRVLYTQGQQQTYPRHIIDDYDRGAVNNIYLAAATRKTGADPDLRWKLEDIEDATLAMMNDYSPIAPKPPTSPSAKPAQGRLDL